AVISANTFKTFGVDRDVTDLTGKARSASPKFPVEDDRAADAVSDRHVEHVVRTSTGPGLELAIGRRVGVVFEFNSQARGSHQLPVQIFNHRSRKISRSYHSIRLAIYQPRNGDADRSDPPA